MPLLAGRGGPHFRLRRPSQRVGATSIGRNRGSKRKSTSTRADPRVPLSTWTRGHYTLVSKDRKLGPGWKGTSEPQPLTWRPPRDVPAQGRLSQEGHADNTFASGSKHNIFCGFSILLKYCILFANILYSTFVCIFRTDLISFINSFGLEIRLI